MKNPSYSVDILQIVIARCCFEELVVTTAIKEELELYQIVEIKELFSFLQKRYGQLIYAGHLNSYTHSQQQREVLVA